MTAKEVEVYRDTIELFAIIKTEYPEFNKTVENDDARIKLWHKMLSKYPKSHRVEAVLKHIEECKFAPKISEIIDNIKLLHKHGAPTLDDYNRMKRFHATLAAESLPETASETKLLTDGRV